MAIAAIAAIVGGLGAAASAAGPLLGDQGNAVVPEAALYEPVDFGEQQIDTILENQDALPFIQNLTRSTNNFITQDALRRARQLIPKYRQNIKLMGANTQDFLLGRLPFEDVQGIIGDRAEMSGGIGIPGAAGPATLKDLGMSRVQAINMGTGMLGDMVRIAETISPRSSYMNPQSMFLNPSQTVPLQIQQRQIEQQSQQNANNLEALSQSNLNPSPSPLTAVGGALGGIGQALGGFAGGGGAATGGLGPSGGYGSAASAQAAAPYAAGYSYNPSIGYSPIAQPVGGYSYFSYGSPYGGGLAA